jgi:NADH-quinone oxidoreductase subunit N
VIHLLSIIEKPFVPGWTTPGASLKPFLAEIILIATMIAVLLAPFVSRRLNITSAFVSLIGLVLAFIATVVIGIDQDSVGNHLRGMLTFDSLAVLWKAMLLLFVIGIVLMWLATTSYSMHEGDGPEFFTLLLGATLGMAFMGSTGNLLMIVMAVELASFPSYVLAGFRKTHKLGAEASLKYVLFGAATSAVMIFGLTLLYGLYGTLQLDQIAKAMANSDVNAPFLAVAILGFVVGLGFKISAVPFHLWCPDVFEGAHVDVSAFLSVASKGAALVLLMRILMTFANAAGYHDVPGISLTMIAVLVGTMGAITCTVGNTGAYVQNNIKRLLAYSSIAHAGYMLCVLSLLLKMKDTQNMADAISALLLYLLVYLFMNLGAFTVAAVVYRQTGREDLGAFEGLGKRSPVLALAMFGAMISLIGLPPFAGFIAKVNILGVLIAAGGWWWALVAVIGVNTILSAFYYFRVIRAVYLGQAEGAEAFVSPLGTALSLACALILVIMLVAYSPFDRLTRSGSHLFFGAPASSVAVK